MSEKPGFMIRHKHMRALFSMSDKDVGALMRLLYSVSIGEEPEPPQKPVMRVAFDMMAEDIREDTEKYKQKVAQAQRAGQASAEARRSSTDVNARQRTSTNNNTIQSNNNNNYQVHANDRDDDMSDVLMEV